jgi:hypothetical protein
MTIDNSFLASARRRLAMVAERIRVAQRHARWHPHNEWEALTGEPEPHAPHGQPADRVGVAAAVSGMLDRSRRPS